MWHKDVYGITQHWIMTVKTHLTGFMNCVALPNKKMNHVAHELEKYFCLVGYPQIFHTDNVKEFTGSSVADLLKANNPHCHVVTSCPRTPQDQGSIESGNKLVHSILKIIQLKQQKSELDNNLTFILGQVAACCNDHSSQMLNSVSP